MDINFVQDQIDELRVASAEFSNAYDAWRETTISTNDPATLDIAFNRLETAKAVLKRLLGEPTDNDDINV